MSLEKHENQRKSVWSITIQIIILQA